MAIDKEETIEQAAAAKRERLKALKAAQQLLENPEPQSNDKEDDNDEENDVNVKFRNYLPHNKQLQEEREDKLSAGNRTVVNKFESELTENIKSLCKTVATSASEQNQQLQCIEKFCHTFVKTNDKAVSDLKRKVSASKKLYLSHLEALQNVVALHKANSNANLEELVSLSSSNTFSVEKLLSEEAVEGLSIFDELHGSLSTQQAEMAHSARELQQKFNVSVGHTKDISNFIHEFFDKLMEKSKELESHASPVNEIQTNNIDEFQLASYKEDGHFERITSDAKRKSTQAENETKESNDFACRIESLLQKCFDATQSAREHSRKTHDSVIEMGRKRVTSVGLLVKSALENIENHNTEIRIADVVNNSDVILKHVDGTSEQERSNFWNYGNSKISDDR